MVTNAVVCSGPPDDGADDWTPAIHPQTPTIPGYFATAALSPGDIVAGRYRIEAMVGVGGMGVVYRALDEELRVEVALKLLRPEFAARPDAFERFRQELLLSRQVSSPHVVRIHDLVADGDRRLISMDFVPGRSLEQRLDAEGALGEKEALAIVRQLALGLAAAHDSDIIHRDLKPANVLLRPDGHACITDFGVARRAAEHRMTATGMLVGTPDYVSPEQARGEDVGPRSDLYALGLILYEMLVGERAFAGATPAESLARRQHAVPPSARQARPELSPWVDRLLARLLDPKPSRRFRDARDVVAAIDAEHVRWRPSWPRWATPALSLVGVAAVAGLIAWSVRPDGAAAKPRDALVVLPFKSEPEHQSLAEAYGALLASDLLAADVSVVDRRRTVGALHRLGYDATAATRHADRLFEELEAAQLLSGALEVRDDLLRIELSHQRQDGSVRSAASDWISVQAMPSALDALADELDLADLRDRPGTPMPTDRRALEAFGKGLLAKTETEAVPHFAEAVTLEPRFVSAWWKYLQLARRLLPAVEVERLVEAARSALRGVRGRDAERARGLMALIEGDATTTIERLAPLVAADPDDHHTRLLHAEALEAAGRHAEASAELTALVGTDAQNGDAWLLLGQNAIRAGEGQRAIDDYLTPARLAFNRLGNPRGESDVVNALGLAFDLIGDPTRAAAHFAEASTLRERIGDSRGAAGSLRNLAWVHAVGGRHVEAEQTLAKAQTLAGAVDDPTLQAHIATDAGLMAEERGQWTKALEHYREALATSRALGQLEGIGAASLNLGFALLQTGSFADARSLFEEAERISVGTGDRLGRVRSLHAIAGLDLRADAVDAAMARIEQAMYLATETNLVLERAVLHVELSRVARRRGDLALASRELRTAESLFEQGGDVRGLAQVRLELAQVHLDAADPAAADAVLQVFNFAEPSSDEQLALLDVRRGEVARQRGDVEAARRLANAALARALRSGSLPARIEARLLLVRLQSGAAALKALDDDLKRFPAGEYAFERRLVDIALGSAGATAYAAPETTAELARHRSREPALHEAGVLALQRAGDAAGAAQARARRDAALKTIRRGLEAATP